MVSSPRPPALETAKNSPASSAPIAGNSDFSTPSAAYPNAPREGEAPPSAATSLTAPNPEAASSPAASSAPQKSVPVSQAGSVVRSDETKGDGASGKSPSSPSSAPKKAARASGRPRRAAKPASGKTAATGGKAPVRATGKKKRIVKTSAKKAAKPRPAAQKRTGADHGKTTSATLPAASVANLFALGRANMDAVLESGVTVLMGVQDYQVQCWGLACETLEQGVEAGASLMTCTSAQDALEIQQSFVQEGLRRLSQATEDLSRISSVTALDALTPLTPALAKGAGARDDVSSSRRP